MGRGTRQDSPSSPISLAVITAIVSVLLVVFFTAAVAGSYALTLHSIDSQRQSEMQQGYKELRSICHTLDSIAALQPPVGSPAENPSRAYEQKFHTVIIQLRPDLGCQRLP